MNPSARSALTLAVLLVLPQLQALCPRLAPDVISGKVIPCRYLCIKINFLELPSIVLSTERDGVLCSTLLLRRRGVCKNGGCMPFGSDDDIKPKGALGKVIAAIDKFASGSYRTKAPKPGTPFGPIVSTASSLFGGGSSKTSGSSSSTSSAASSIVATATAAAVGSTFKKLLAHGASVLSEKKKHDEHPFSSILTSVSKPDHHPTHTPGGAVSSSSGAVAVSFGGGPPVLPPSTEGGAENVGTHAAPGIPSTSSPGPSEHPVLPPFISSSEPKPKDSLNPGSPSGAPNSNGNVIKHALGIVLGNLHHISGTRTSGTPSASIPQNGPSREASGGGGATPTEFPYGHVPPIAPSPFSSGTKHDGRERLPGIPASANAVEAGHPPMPPAASSVTNIGYVSKPSTIPSPYSRSPNTESRALSSASRAENSSGSQLNGPYGAAMARLREISQGSTRETVPGHSSLASLGGTSVPSSGSGVTSHKGASGSEVNHNKVTVTNVPNAAAAPITADYGHGHPSVLPSTARVFESKLEGAPQWSGAPKMVSGPLNTATQAAGLPTGTLQRASELTPSNTVRMTSPLIGNGPLRSTSTYLSEILSETPVKTSLAKTLGTAKQVPAGAAPVIPVGKPLSPVPGDTSILPHNPMVEFSPQGANKPDAIRRELGMRPLSAKPAPAAVELGRRVPPIALSSMAVPGNKGAEGSQPLTAPSTILGSTVIAAETSPSNLNHVRSTLAISSMPSGRPSPSIGSSGLKLLAASGSRREAPIQAERTFDKALNILRQGSGTTESKLSFKETLPRTANLSKARKTSAIQSLPAGANQHVVKAPKEAAVGALGARNTNGALLLGGGLPSVTPSATAQAVREGAEASRLSAAPSRRLRLGLLKPAEADINTARKPPTISTNRHKNQPSTVIGSAGLGIVSAFKSATAVRSPMTNTFGVTFSTLRRASNNVALTPALGQLSALPAVVRPKPSGSTSIQDIHKGSSSLESNKGQNVVSGVLLGIPKRRNEQLGSGAPTLPSPIIGETANAARTSQGSTTQNNALQPRNEAAAASGVLPAPSTTPSTREQRSEADEEKKKQGVGSLAGTKNAVLPSLQGKTAHSSHTKSPALPVKSGGSSVLPNSPATKKGSAGKTSGPGSGASHVRTKKRFFRGFFRRFKHKRKQNRGKSQSTPNKAVKGGAAPPSRDLDSTKSKIGILLNSGVKGSTLPSPPAAVPHIVPNPLSTPSQRKEHSNSPRRIESQPTKSTGVESIIFNKKITNRLGKTEDTLQLKRQRAPSKLHTKGSPENNVSPVRSSSHGGVETKVIVGRKDLSGKAGHINLPNHVPPKLNFGAAVRPIANTQSTSRITATLSALPTTALQGNKQGSSLGQRNEKKAPLTVPSHTGTTERNPNNRANIESVNNPSRSSLSNTTPSTKEETSNAESPATELPSRHGSTVTGSKIISPGPSSISPRNTVSASSKPPATIGTPSSTPPGNQLAPKPIAPQQNRVPAVAVASKGGNASYGSNQGSQTSLPRILGSRVAAPNAVPPNIGAPSPRGSATSTTVTAAKNAPPSVSSISRDNTITIPSKPTTSTGTLSSGPSGNQISPKPIAAQQHPASFVAAAPRGTNPSYGVNQGSRTSLPRTASTRDETKNAASPSIVVPSPHGSATPATVPVVKNPSPGISSTLRGNTVATPFRPTSTSGAPSSAHSGRQLTPKPVAAQQNPAPAVAAASYTGSQGSQTSGPMEKTANAPSTGGNLSIKSGTSSQSPPSTSGRLESKISPGRDNSSNARYVSTTQTIDGVSKASEKPTAASAALHVSKSTSVSATSGGQTAPSVPSINAASRIGGTLATMGASETPLSTAGSLPTSKGSVSLGPSAHLVRIPAFAPPASGIPLASSVRNVMAANRLAGTSGTAGTSEKYTPTASSPSGIKGSASLIGAVNGVKTPRQSSLKPPNTIANVHRSSTSIARAALVAKAALRLAAPIKRAPSVPSSSIANIPSTLATLKTNPSSRSPQTSRNQSMEAKNVIAPGSASNLAANAPRTSAPQNVQSPKLLAETRTMASVKNIQKSEPRLRSLPLLPEVNATNNAKAPGGSASSLQKVGTNSKNIGAPASPALTLPGKNIASSGPVQPGKTLQPPEKPSGLVGRLGGFLSNRRDALKSAVQSGSSAVSNVLSKIATNNVKNTVTEARPTTVANGPTQLTAPEKQPPPPTYVPPGNTPTNPINNAEQQNPPMYPGMQQPGGMVFGRHPMQGGYWGPPQGMPGMFRPF